MLSPLQIKRVLKHCEKVDEDYVKDGSTPAPANGTTEQVEAPIF